MRIKSRRSPSWRKNNREMDKLEDRFYATFKRPLCKPVHEVFKDWVVRIEQHSFTVEFVDHARHVYGIKPPQRFVVKNLATSLMKRMNFIPPSDMIDKVIACNTNHRVAYYLKSGLQVVDDTSGKLAVHIMRDPYLAENLVQGWITVASAKKDCDYIARIPHEDGYERKVMEIIGR